jgi:RHS repeat-associated protein
VTDPTTSYTYDSAGNLRATADPRGVTTTDSYTPLNQLQTVSYSDSTPGASYVYDASGNKVAMSDGAGASSYEYNPFSELSGYTNGAGQHVGYSYDQDGNLTGLTYPLGADAGWASGDTINYGYDNADELASITDFNGTTSSLSNTSDGLPHVLALGTAGDAITTNYDPTDTPSDIKLADGTTVLQEFAYADTPSGTVNSETDTPSSPQAPAGYDYDAQGRVTEMTPGSGSAASYGYDASGNLTTLPTGATAGYDDASELTSSTLSGATTDYAYNKDGERTAETVGGANSVTATYSGAQELLSYSDNAANMTAATYDGTGVRQTATTTPAHGSSTTEHFTWDPSGALARLLMDSNSAYIYGPGDRPFEQVNLATGSVQYLVGDRLGSVRGIVDSTGAMTATASYDAWGNPQTVGGLTSYTPFGYAGYYTDPTGLTYNLARYYDPTTGQFFVVDPKVATTLQAYEYANDDPVVRADPNGLDPDDEEEDAGGEAGSPGNASASGAVFNPVTLGEVAARTTNPGGVKAALQTAIGGSDVWDVTDPGSTPNYATNANPAQFALNLQEDGWETREIERPDGKLVATFKKGANEFSLRDFSKSGGEEDWTAAYINRKTGKTEQFKLRLGR